MVLLILFIFLVIFGFATYEHSRQIRAQRQATIDQASKLTGPSYSQESLEKYPTSDRSA